MLQNELPKIIRSQAVDMSSKHVNMLSFISYQGMYIRIAVTCCLTSTKLATIEKSDHTKYWK